MYCRKCGTWCEDSAVFCTQCGEALGEKTSSNTAQTTYDKTAGGMDTSYNNGYHNNYNANYGGGYGMGTTYAGFWKRFGAIIIDGFIVGIANSIIGFILGSIGLEGMVSILATITTWLYYAYMESSEYQATLGKMALQLRVTDINGNRISFARATARHFSKMISGFILFIGYMMAGWTEKKQALHDIIAGTSVVKE